MICSRVDLPQPDGPMMDTKLPRSMSRSTPLERDRRAARRREALVQAADRRNDRDGSVID